jgi:hypothetical protein
MIINGHNTAIHSAVHLAGDVVFTKNVNGPHHVQWTPLANLCRLSPWPANYASNILVRCITSSIVATAVAQNDEKPRPTFNGVN